MQKRPFACPAQKGWPAARSSSPGQLNGNEIGGLTREQRELAIGFADSVNPRQEGEECWEQGCFFPVSTGSVHLSDSMQDRFDSLRQLVLRFLSLGRSPRCSRSRNNYGQFDFDNPL